MRKTKAISSKCCYWLLLAVTLGFSQVGVSEQAHFHHLGLNVQNTEANRAFYQKVFGAVPINFNSHGPALFTERSFILFNSVKKPAYSNLKTAIWHIGWGGVDGPNEYKWWLSQGVEFYTPLTELGRNHYMYLYGPDREIIEIYTGGKHHRFNHVHILASKPLATARWFQQNLGLNADQVRNREDRSFIDIDNVQIIVYPNSDQYRPNLQGPELMPTDDSVIAHIGFSFRDLDRAYQHFVENQANIVAPIKTSERHGLASFFVRAPDGILVEIVQVKPIPEGIRE